MQSTSSWEHPTVRQASSRQVLKTISGPCRQAGQHPPPLRQSLLLRLQLLHALQQRQLLRFETRDDRRVLRGELEALRRHHRHNAVGPRRGRWHASEALGWAHLAHGHPPGQLGRGGGRLLLRVLHCRGMRRSSEVQPQERCIFGGEGVVLGKDVAHRILQATKLVKKRLQLLPTHSQRDFLLQKLSIPTRRRRERCWHARAVLCSGSHRRRRRPRRR
mmetsp:Transcript_2359/g.6722  ORF Transcript_2359/g.6722 Transcript_2359/m.6722 type:complete len:218 (-) Transcript_2359:1395-2048(-)